MVELYRYFFNERINVGGYIELPKDENYVLIPQVLNSLDPSGISVVNATGSYQFCLEAYNQTSNEWDLLSQTTVDSGTATNGFIINTYAPFYNYDPQEHPQKYSDSEDYLIRGSGYRNFERSLVTKKENGTINEVEIKRLRLKYLGGTGTTGGGTYAIPFLNVKKSDYANDEDIKQFQGFIGLT